MSIKNRISGFFKINEILDYSYVIEHIATKEKVNLQKESFEYIIKKKSIDDIYFINIVSFKNEYWFSGTCSIYEYDEEMVKTIEKESLLKDEFNFLPKNNIKIQEILNNQLVIFNKINDNKLLKYLKGNEIQSFMNKFYLLYNQTLNKNVSDNNNINNDFDFDEDDILIVFFNIKSGIEIAYNVPFAFPITYPFKGNREEMLDDFYTVIVDETISTELAIKSYHEFLSSNIEEIKDVFIFSDFDFLLRFYKTKEYFTKPSITLI